MVQFSSRTALVVRDGTALAALLGCEPSSTTFLGLLNDRRAFAMGCAVDCELGSAADCLGLVNDRRAFITTQWLYVCFD